MEATLKNKKECKDCVHFIAHFIKDKTKFVPIIQGHCSNPKPSGHYRKTDNACECYEERDFQKEKDGQIQSATESLSYIAQRISHLAQILNMLADDERN